MGVLGDAGQGQFRNGAGLGDGRRLGQQLPQDGRRAAALGQSGKEVVGPIVRRGGGEQVGNAIGNVAAQQPVDQFRQLRQRIRQQIRRQSRLGLGQRQKVILRQKLNIRVGSGVFGPGPTAGPAIEPPLGPIGQHAKSVGAAGLVLFQITLNLLVGGVGAGLPGGNLVKIRPILLGLDDNRRPARIGRHFLQKAGFVQPIAAGAVFRVTIGRRIAQSGQGRLNQQVQGGRLADGVPPPLNMPQSVPQQAGYRFRRVAVAVRHCAATPS